MESAWDRHTKRERNTPLNLTRKLIAILMYDIAHTPFSCETCFMNFNLTRLTKLHSNCITTNKARITKTLSLLTIIENYISLFSSWRMNIFLNWISNQNITPTIGLITPGKWYFAQFLTFSQKCCIAAWIQWMISQKDICGYLKSKEVSRHFDWFHYTAHRISTQ